MAHRLPVTSAASAEAMPPLLPVLVDAIEHDRVKVEIQVERVTAALDERDRTAIVLTRSIRATSTTGRIPFLIRVGA